MTERDLITDINDEITFSGALPYNIPEKDIKKIIKNAKLYFYDHWRDALEPRYLLIPPQIFTTPQFKDNRSITLPDCVWFVHRCQELGQGGSIFGTMDRDFGDSKFLGTELTLSPAYGDALVYRTVMMSFLDLTKAFTLNGIVGFDFNKNSKRLIITGRTVDKGLAVKVMVQINDEALYNDEMFQRYTRAKAKMRLAQMLSSFEFNLPGGVKINYSNLSAQADKELEKVLEDMKGENTPDFMLFYH